MKKKSAGRKRMILLIEDDFPILEIYKTVLTVAGFKVEAANCGADALNKLERISPDLILLDLILPDISGLQILRKIRADKKTENIPVFVVTNYCSAETEKESYDLNAKYFIKTDYVPGDLVKMINKEFSKKS